MTTTHRVAAERDGDGWSVRIDGLPGPDRFHARDLADVEPRALKLLWGYSGHDADDITIDIEVRLPTSIQDRLDIIRQHCDDLETEYDAAIRELTEAGLSLSDVSRVLRLHHRPPRPLTVTNDEIATYGLDRHPDAVGVEWDDHQFAVTRKCRAHLDATRNEYGALPPDGENALIYQPTGFRCDFCEEGGGGMQVNGDPIPEMDIGVAHAGRIYDYLLGGVDNFEVDRQAAKHANADMPGGLDGARANVRANRTFLGRTVHYLAGEAGVRQFLDIGTGIPNADNVHAVAQATAPASRIVYVDNDPIVLAHAHTLLQSTPEGVTAFLHGDLRDPDDILSEANATLDFSEPVAVMLVAILHFFGEEDEPYSIVARLMDAMCAGSYLVISHGAADIDAENMTELAKRLSERSRETFVWRTRTDVCRFFDGLALLEPGVVPVDQWRADDATPSGVERTIPFYGGIGRKP